MGGEAVGETEGRIKFERESPKHLLTYFISEFLFRNKCKYIFGNSMEYVTEQFCLFAIICFFLNIGQVNRKINVT